MASKSKRRSQKREAAAAPTRREAPRRAVPRSGPRRPTDRKPPVRATRPSRRLYAYVAGGAALVGSLLIGLSLVSAQRGTTGTPESSAAPAGVAATAALLDGIPQRGNVLGSPTAPVRLVEYADPQCPFCAVYARDVLPTLVREYVRTGKVQLEFRGLWFLGEDSGTALRTAVAAGADNRMWNVLGLLFASQGPENAWVTDDLLRSIVDAAGADASRVFDAREGAAVGAALDGWERRAQADGVTGVPTFFVGPRGAALDRIALTSIAVPGFRSAIETALAQPLP